MIYFVVLTSKSDGQQINTINNNQLFTNGIYLKNLKLNLPWIIDFTHIKDYGNPKIISLSKTGIQIKWDSVIILNDVIISFSYYNNKKVLNKTNWLLSPVFGDIDSISFTNLKNLFEEYSKESGKLTRRKKMTYYYWIIDGCNIKLGYTNFNHYFLWIQRRKIK